ncbi:MAG: FAD:protein FMN transferase [Planctomycetota bacterium]
MINKVYPRRPIAAAALFCWPLLVMGWLGTWLLGCHPTGGPAPAARVSESMRLMGVPWTITVYADSEAAGRTAIAAGFAEAARLERVLSDYDPESELSRLSAQAPTSAPQPLSDDLWRVLEQSLAIRDATDGAFDPTVGPLTTLWRQARRSGRLPLPDKLAAAREAVGPETLRLVPEARAAMLTRPAMRLDLGGIGMGYTIARTLAVLGRQGIKAAMIDASGDIAVSAAPPGTSGWKIAVAALQPAGGAGAADGGGDGDGETLLLQDAAVTTSGDAFQAVEIAGRRYSHIVDPRTGLGVAGPAAVTVVAPDCTTADALATAASVLGPERFAAVIDGSPGRAARFVWQEDGRVKYAQTKHWPSQTTQSHK